MKNSREIDWTWTDVVDSSSIPLGRQLVCRYKKYTNGRATYVVLKFENDSEYGICAHHFESYIYPEEIDKFVTIK